ncbi:MAG: thioesterase family protein [Bacteroidota bacterium]
MIRYVHRHRVRYRECDPMGVVYHAHVLDWFEAARTEALRSAGLPYADLEAGGVIMPVTEATVRYHASARYDDEVEIETTFPEVGVRVPIDYAVRRAGEDAVLMSGRVTLCFVDVARGRPVPPPAAVQAAFDRAEAAARAAERAASGA